MIHLWSDGGVIKKNPSVIGGTVAYVISDADVTNHSYVFTPQELGVKEITNNQMELLAIILGLEDIANDEIVHIFSDSEISLGRIFMGYAMKNIPEIVKDKLIEQIHKFRYFEKFRYTLLSGHPTKDELEKGISKSGHPDSKLESVV